MQKFKEIHPTQPPTDSGEWQAVQPIAATIVNQSTGMVEWSAKLTERELLDVQKKLKVQKVDVERANEIYRLIREGKSVVDIRTIKRGKKGYSIPTIKRYSAALSAALNWKRNIAVSKIK